MLGSSKPEPFPGVVAGAGVTGEKTVGGRSRPFLAVLGGLGPWPGLQPYCALRSLGATAAVRGLPGDAWL